MSSRNLKLDIDEFIAVSKVRIDALARASIQDVITEAQTTTSRGGRMRVDTGFLRASGQASLSGMPTGPARGENKTANAYTWNDQNLVLTLGQFTVGNTFFFGWTAAYAAVRNVYDGFLDAAVQNWPQIVARNADLIRERVTMNAVSTYQRGG